MKKELLLAKVIRWFYRLYYTVVTLFAPNYLLNKSTWNLVMNKYLRMWLEDTGVLQFSPAFFFKDFPRWYADRFKGVEEDIYSLIPTVGKALFVLKKIANHPLAPIRRGPHHSFIVSGYEG